jgi:hypothetical protein
MSLGRDQRDTIRRLKESMVVSLFEAHGNIHTWLLARLTAVYSLTILVE